MIPVGFLRPDMSTILLPVNNYAPWARSVASIAVEYESDDVSTLVLHVFDEQEVQSTRENLGVGPEANLSELASRKSGVSAATGVLEAAGISCETLGARHEGEPADAILSAAEDNDVEKLYLAGRRRSPAGKALFGSTLQRVLLRTRVPVVVVPVST